MNELDRLTNRLIKLEETKEAYIKAKTEYERLQTLLRIYLSTAFDAGYAQWEISDSKRLLAFYNANNEEYSLCLSLEEAIVLQEFLNDTLGKD
jgi:hypothetical protein